MNSLRRSAPLQFDDEESTLLEEPSEIFDENDHRQVIEDYNQIPLLVSAKVCFGLSLKILSLNKNTN